MNKDLELEINERFQAILQNCKNQEVRRIVEALMLKTSAKLKEKK